MQVFRRLWSDESGVLLSAEAVVVGTVAVVGLTAGLSTVASSVNEELRDVGFAIRSLDQSYTIPAMEGCGACTAGSSFTQEPVEKSLKELDAAYRKAEASEKQAAARAKAQQERLKEQAERQNSKKDPSKDKKKPGKTTI
ncbi:MAG: hypothetical protein KDA91_21190 [Planctomycetaceae bacterium]|nr:hypothetical protein [Planctomycetaceae bacterium]